MLCNILHLRFSILLLGEIMKMGYSFACFMSKKIVFSQFLQIPTYKSNFFI
jgi:hypothetical protein